MDLHVHDIVVQKNYLPSTSISAEFGSCSVDNSADYASSIFLVNITRRFLLFKVSVHLKRYKPGLRDLL